MGCPTHRSAAELALIFRYSLKDEVHESDLSIRSTGVPVIETYTLPSLIPVVNYDSIYAAKLIFKGKVRFQQIYYGTHYIKCISNGVAFHAQHRSFDPLWDTANSNIIFTFHDVSRDTDKHVEYYKVCIFKQIHNYDLSHGVLYPITYMITTC